MFDLSNANDDIVAQLLVAQRMLSDVSARLVRESDEPTREAARREDPTPRSFGYTNSLEGLIQSGKQYGTIYAEPPWPCDDSPTQQRRSPKLILRKRRSMIWSKMIIRKSPMTMTQIMFPRLMNLKRTKKLWSR